MFRTILITGANRGIGLQFVKHLISLKTKPYQVIATYRTAEKSKELLELTKEISSLHAVQMEVTEETSVKEAVQQIDQIVGENGVSLLINNSGIEPKFNSMNDITTEGFRSTMDTNILGPILVTRSMLPLLNRASAVSNRVLVVNISTAMASVSKATLSSYAYRISKCGVNMLTKLQHLELSPAGISVVCIHPGWVQTDMGGSKAPLTPAESVTHIWNVFSKLQPDQSGSFLNYDGTPLSY